MSAKVHKEVKSCNFFLHFFLSPSAENRKYICIFTHLFVPLRLRLEGTSVRKCPNKFGISLTYSYLCPRKNEQTDISYHCVSGGGSVGHYICLYQVIADGRTDSSTDIRVALYYSLRDVAGVFADAQAFPMVLEGVAGRAADGGTGHYGWFAVFPDRELGDDLHDDDEHVADSMYVSAVCRTVDSAVLPFAASARTADSRNGDGGDWRGGGGTERSFCFTPFTLG